MKNNIIYRCNNLEGYSAKEVVKEDFSIYSIAILYKSKKETHKTFDFSDKNFFYERVNQPRIEKL